MGIAMSTSLFELIRRQEEQLAELRRRFEEKQERLANLRAKRDTLLAQLHQLDHDISTLMTELGITNPPELPSAPATGPQPAATPTSSTVAQPTPPSNGAFATGDADPSYYFEQPRLQDFIMDVLKQAQTPLTAKMIAQQVIAAGYRTRSRHFINVVQNTLRGMMNQLPITFEKRVGYFLAKE
jgi:hypothetical protein